MKSSINRNKGVKKPMFNKMTKALIEATRDWVGLHSPVDLTMESYEGKNYSGGFYMDGAEVAAWKFKPDSTITGETCGCLFSVGSDEKAVHSIEESTALVVEFFTKTYMKELVSDLVYAEAGAKNVSFELDSGKRFSGTVTMLTSKGSIIVPWSIRYEAGTEKVVFNLSDKKFTQPNVGEIAKAASEMLAHVEHEFATEVVLSKIQASIEGYATRLPGNKFTPDIVFSDVVRTSHRIEGVAALTDGSKSVEWWIVQQPVHGTLGCTENHEQAKPITGLTSLHSLIVEGLESAPSAGEVAIATKAIASEELSKKELRNALALNEKLAVDPVAAEVAASAVLAAFIAEANATLVRVNEVLAEVKKHVALLPQQKPVILLVSTGTIWAVPVEQMPLDLCDLNRVALSPLEPSTHAQLVDWLTQGDGLQYVVNNETVSGPVVHVEHIDLAADFDETTDEMTELTGGLADAATSDTKYSATNEYPVAEINVVEKVSASVPVM